MQKINYSSLILVIIMLLCISDGLGANMDRQEISCYKGNSPNATMGHYLNIQNMMPPRKGLTMTFSKIEPRAEIFIDNIGIGSTDNKGNLPPRIEFPLSAGKKELLIKVNNSIVHQCEFKLSQDSKLECTGTNNFKCILSRIR